MTSMSAGEIDVMNEALRCYRQRRLRLLDLIPRDEADAMMTREANFIVKAGPEAYLACLDDLDVATVLADLDAHLDRTLARILDDGDEP